jgi:hypothetical protein
VTGPSDDPVFFIDRSFGRHVVPQALRDAGVLVEIHDDHFDQAADDESWLAEVGSRGWFVLTKDARIRRTPLQLQTLEAAGVGAFILTAPGKNGAEMASILLSALSRIRRVARQHVRPFVATISSSGHVRIVRGGERRGGIRRDRQD